jgi:hypothetical protein
MKLETKRQLPNTKIFNIDSFFDFQSQNTYFVVLVEKNLLFFNNRFTVIQDWK